MVALGITAVLGFTWLLASPGAVDSSVASRPQMWQWAIDLIADYPFTGSGLGSTMMVHASYLLIIHVGFLPHMHNLVLQVGIEQGIPGLLTFLALAALAVSNVVIAYRRGADLWLSGGAVVALTTLAVQGTFDAVPYASRLAFITFVPLGFALGLRAPPGLPGAAAARAARVSTATLAALLALLAAGSLAIVLSLPSGQAALQSNLGAVAQTRAELGRYVWPEWPIQDALRRSPQIDLQPAIARYQAALASNPRQASANRRLGQIELSQGAYDAARLHLETAYRQAPQRYATRLLLGESYAIAGQPAEAATLWRSISSQMWWQEDWLARSVLQGREYWYDSIGEPQRAQALRLAREQISSN